MGAKNSKRWLQLKSQQNEVCKQLESCLKLNLTTTSGKVALERTLEKVRSQLSNEQTFLRPIVFSQNPKIIKEFAGLNKELEGIYKGLNSLKSNANSMSESNMRGDLNNLTRKYRQNLLRKERAFWDKINQTQTDIETNEFEEESFDASKSTHSTES